MSKTVLICGCSFTADSGFTVENYKTYHYISLLKDKYQIEFDNIAIGGMSNREIMLRTAESIVLGRKQYDAVIVQWTSLPRWWFYKNSPNVDDFTGINNRHVFGLAGTHNAVLRKILLTEFDNQYVLLKQWLLDCISLGKLLENQVPYIFCLGFNNWLVEFEKIEYSNGFQHLTSELSVILDLRNRPDSYILDRVTKIKDLITIVKQYNWNNFSNQDWFSHSVDLSDDQLHPGIMSNANWAKSLEPFMLNL